MNQRSVAVQGIGFGALAIATMGLLGGIPEPVATMGTVTLELIDAATSDFEITERPEWNPI